MTILFDMDGTLIDSTPAILESFGEAFKSHGVGFSDFDKIPPLIGHTLEDMFVALGVDRAAAPQFRDAYKFHYRKIAAQKTTLLPSAAEAVKLASTFANLGIVTTKTALYTKEILDHFGLLGYFKAVIGREDVENPKPHAEPVLKALSMLGAEKKNAWLIGDTMMDLHAAKNAQIAFFGVLCGYGTRNDLMCESRYIAENAFSAVKFIRANSE